MGVSMGAQGGSRAVGMWEGAAMQVADHSKRVVSGRRVVGCAVGSNRAYGWRITQPYPTKRAPPPRLRAGVLLAAMMAGFAPQTCFRSCCQLAAPFPASLRPGARFRAAHPPRPHVGSGVHRRGGLGWVKGRRAYQQSPGPIVSRAGTRLRSRLRSCDMSTIYAERRRGFTPLFNTSNTLLSFL